MGDDPEDETMREMRRLAELIPNSQRCVPPGSLIARIYGLVPTPSKGERFAFADSEVIHAREEDSTAWRIVVANETHIVNITASAPIRSWIWMEDDAPGYRFQQEKSAVVSADRLRLDKISRISTGGEPQGWLTDLEALPTDPRWVLHWPDAQVELPVSHAPSRRAAWRARAFVVGRLSTS